MQLSSALLIHLRFRQRFLFGSRNSILICIEAWEKPQPSQPSDSTIANKRRPKKIRPPYRKYVYKASYTEEGRSDDEANNEGGESKEVVRDRFGNWQDFNAKTNMNIRSVYILTSQHNITGQVWPRSQFEKVDVLHWCLYFNSDEHKAILRELEEEERRQRAKADLLVLPLELIVHIFEILLWQNLLTPRFLRVSKLIYLVVLPMIYRRPVLKGNNFFAFVETISSNKKIGGYIRDLDLANVNQSGKNAFVAKLLKRSRPYLEAFTAPQTSFGLGPLMALRSCDHLRILDLLLVSETLNLEELFHSIRDLDNLTHLSFPRSSLEINDYSGIHWPPKLQYLRVSGGISDDFLIESEFPSTIAHMEFAHCPKVRHSGFQHLLSRFGPNLKSLKIQFPMPGLHANSLDTIFVCCPNLNVLEVTVDYLSSGFFDDDLLPQLPYPRPLRALYIDSSGMLGTNDKIDPIDLAVALNDGRLPNLKNVRCTAKLGWDPKSEYVSYIADEMDERHGGLYIGY